jgi:hypothetical protein
LFQREISKSRFDAQHPSYDNKSQKDGDKDVEMAKSDGGHPFMDMSVFPPGGKYGDVARSDSSSGQQSTASKSKWDFNKQGPGTINHQGLHLIGVQQVWLGIPAATVRKWTKNIQDLCPLNKHSEKTSPKIEMRA